MPLLLEQVHTGFPLRPICARRESKRGFSESPWHSGKTRCRPECVCARIGAHRTLPIPNKNSRSMPIAVTTAITYRSPFRSTASWITAGGIRARRCEILKSAVSPALTQTRVDLRCAWRMARNSLRGVSWSQPESARLRPGLRSLPSFLQAWLPIPARTRICENLPARG
jgi:hypothetical protein